jgi:hypothetical protein
VSDDWMRPITKPLPGPVSTEDKQMSVAERESMTLIAAHNAGLHYLPEAFCSSCRLEGRV